MDVDLNEPAMFDPLEVIIHPINPPPMDFLELNDFIEKVEENIPQPVAQDLVGQIRNLVNAVQENVPAMMEGFPIPPLKDLIGEEVPLDQLVGPEDDIQLDQLVGPGEEGFPKFANGEGMQLPPNPMEGALLNLADELQQEQSMEQEVEELHVGMEINQVDIGGQQGQAAPDNPQHDNEQAA